MPQKSRGYSLVELVVTLGVLSIILGFAIHDLPRLQALLRSPPRPSSLQHVGLLAGCLLAVAVVYGHFQIAAPQRAPVGAAVEAADDLGIPHGVDPEKALQAMLAREQKLRDTKRSVPAYLTQRIERLKAKIQAASPTTR